MDIDSDDCDDKMFVFIEVYNLPRPDFVAFSLHFCVTKIHHKGNSVLQRIEF